jgi:hypothetical protein
MAQYVIIPGEMADQVSADLGTPRSSDQVEGSPMNFEGIRGWNSGQDLQTSSSMELS